MPIDLSALAAYLQVTLVNVVLSGDNVVVIGMAAAGLAPALRPRAVVAGIAAAAAIRLGFAVIATRLLAIPGLLLAGGLLLLWVCWNMFAELRAASSGEALPGASPAADKTLWQAIFQIVIADVSMSLDNVLAVAGASAGNLPALIFGLALSVLLMGLAANFVAKLMGRHRWIGWVGLALIVYIAGGMLIEGAFNLRDMLEAGRA